MITWIKWIIELTQRKPILGFLASILIGMSIMGSVCLHLYNKLEESNRTILVNERYYQRKFETKDSLWKLEVIAIQEKANREVHDYLVKANAEMSEQIKQLQEINSGRDKIYSTNQKLLNKHNVIIKKLKDVK